MNEYFLVLDVKKLLDVFISKINLIFTINYDEFKYLKKLYNLNCFDFFNKLFLNFSIIYKII
jgi:hypothetical protein